MHPLTRLSPIGCSLLLLALAGCEPELTQTLEGPETERFSGDLVDQLAGHWELHTVYSSDCPADWQHGLAPGTSHWTDQGDHLSIRPDAGLGSPIQLWPVDSQSLERVLHMAVEECEGTETITLLVDTVRAGFAAGSYSSVLTHNGDGCRQLPGQADLPDFCETVVHWQAKRLSH